MSASYKCNELSRPFLQVFRHRPDDTPPRPDQPGPRPSLAANSGNMDEAARHPPQATAQNVEEEVVAHIAPGILRVGATIPAPAQNTRYEPNGKARLQSGRGVPDYGLVNDLSGPAAQQVPVPCDGFQFYRRCRGIQAEAYKRIRGRFPQRGTENPETAVEFDGKDLDPGYPSPDLPVSRQRPHKHL